jgi:hypothetical protein
MRTDQLHHLVSKWHQFQSLVSRRALGASTRGKTQVRHGSGAGVVAWVVAEQAGAVATRLLRDVMIMRSSADRGRVYRRCGCRDGHGRQLGARCPALVTQLDHGTWTFAVDLPAPVGQRNTVRRGGFPTEQVARSALRRLLEGAAGGFDADPNQTVADYLISWLEAKALTLKPTTVARYRDYVTKGPHPCPGQPQTRRPRPPAHHRLRHHTTRPGPGPGDPAPVLGHALQRAR